MIGSRTGWHEAPYVECPANPAQLVAHAVRFRINDHPAAILPGACVRTDDGDVDVMRGEELQLLGIVDTIELDDALVCIPGTHCKWARLAGGALIDFRTLITGELFQLLRRQSLVGALAEGDAFDAIAFRRGVLRGADRTLANAVFAARANALAGTLTPVEVSAYLSGVLIGSEIKAQNLASGQDVVLLATGVLAERYDTALGILGISARLTDAKVATQAGLLLAARELWFQDFTA
jgi:2-dehydro-3-deoxygalactonokinase